MSTDRELLELAAKAAGIEGEWVDGEFWLLGERTPDNDRTWNPIDRDGDALRLAVKLRIVHWVHNERAYAEWSIGTSASMQIDAWCGRFKGDECAAIRNVIVRAAAEIGRSMP